jgi:hypothetical protein
VLGQIVTLLLPAITAAAQSDDLSIGGIISRDRRRRWWRHTHGGHWRNQEQSYCLTGMTAL